MGVRRAVSRAAVSPPPRSSRISEYWRSSILLWTSCSWAKTPARFRRRCIAPALSHEELDAEDRFQVLHRPRDAGLGDVQEPRGAADRPSHHDGQMISIWRRVSVLWATTAREINAERRARKPPGHRPDAAVAHAERCRAALASIPAGRAGDGKPLAPAPRESRPSALLLPRLDIPLGSR